MGQKVRAGGLRGFFIHGLPGLRLVQGVHVVDAAGACRRVHGGLYTGVEAQRRIPVDNLGYGAAGADFGVVEHAFDAGGAFEAGAADIYEYQIRADKKTTIMEIIKGWQKLSGDCMDFLRQEVRFTIVTIPEALAFEQLDGVFKEMERNGFKIGQLVINNVIESDESEFLKSKAAQQRRYLDMIHERFSGVDIVELAMRPYEIKGIERLKEIEKSLFV